MKEVGFYPVLFGDEKQVVFVDGGFCRCLGDLGFVGFSGSPSGCLVIAP